MGKIPASLFYWGDFIRDPDLRRCSNAAVGVWIRLLCLMFECEPKGVLATNGVPWSDEDVALAVGGRWEETNACLTELVTKGVASRNAAGALMNRRMYRDEKIRDDTRERVRKFREKHGGNAKCNEESNADVRQCTETETETETETSVSGKEKPIESVESKAEIVAQEEAIYEAYPRKVGRAVALKAIRKAVDRLRVGSNQKDPMSAREARRWLWKRVAEYALSTDGKKPADGGDDYRPHPATWFNGERYFDDTSEWNRIHSGGNGHVNGNGNGYAKKPTLEERNLAVLRESAPELFTAQGADSGGRDAPPDGQRPGDKLILAGRMGGAVEPF